MDPFPSKRKAEFGSSKDDNVRKMSKKSGLSFAERMMAKMGHKPGQGLGKAGEGRLNPIEVQLRPQGIGLGSVREKSKEAKEEDKRQAKLRGEKYEDSSDEEESARWASKARKQSTSRHSTSIDAGKAKRGAVTKVKYQTAVDLEEATEGLEIPNIFKDIIDATGIDRKMLTSGDGIFTSAQTGTDLVESDKIKSRARREVEAFADSWNHLKEREKDIELEAEQVIPMLAQCDDSIKATEDLLNALQLLSKLQIKDMEGEEEQWQTVTTSLQALHDRFGLSSDQDLDLIAVSVIQPLFKQAMTDWHPLDEPDRLVAYLERLKPILSPPVYAPAENEDGYNRRHKAMTAYESLIYSTWRPKIRSAITNSWDVHEPGSLVILLDAWRLLLPDFIIDLVINNFIVQKLVDALQSWNPKTAMRRNYSKHGLPHVWILPWLPYLSSDHTDPMSRTGLLSDVNRKLGTGLDAWDVSRGIMPGITEWAPLLSTVLQHTLVQHILPRLAAYMADNFEVYPPDQDLTPLENVLLWKDLLPAQATAQLLIAEFFPKWRMMLHAWLTGDTPNFDEIQVWFGWWKDQIAADLNQLPAIAQDWHQGSQMISAAVDLYIQDKDLGLLPAPSIEPTKPVAKAKAATSVPAAMIRPDEIPQFRDVVERWCEEENLLLLPLREAHRSTGLPLLRLTASATGRGGILVYIKGDVVFGQQKKGDRSAWTPFELGEALLQRAEAR